MPDGAGKCVPIDPVAAGAAVRRWTAAIREEAAHMRSHHHDTESGELRPKAARLDPEPTAHQMQAAAQGRTDVLDPAAVLGLQRAVGNSGVTEAVEADRSPVHGVINSGGQPLTPDVRTEMESRLGHDFGDVRVHTDSAAHDSAKSVSAHAYTVGSNVVFQRDMYDPSSNSGKTMLAHELTHVVQQRAGAVDGTPAAGGIKVSDPSDRFEREASANAERVMSSPAPAATVAAPSGAAVQREEAPEEEEAVQGAFVQREGEDEEQVEE
jgi:Domain of unknown function (DUF4157)